MIERTLPPRRKLFTEKGAVYDAAVIFVFGKKC
jgi:hypothetical protein